MKPEEKLERLGLSLGEPLDIDGTYIGCVRTGSLIFTAGRGGNRYFGKLGQDLSIEEGYKASEEAMLHLLRVLKDELGELSRIKQVVKVHGMINSTVNFTDQPSVLNGASDLLVKLFGEQGKHARSAVGMAQLPHNMAVEIEMVVEVD